VLHTPPACLSACSLLKEATLFWMELEGPADALAALPDTLEYLSLTLPGPHFWVRSCWCSTHSIPASICTRPCMEHFCHDEVVI